MARKPTGAIKLPPSPTGIQATHPDLIGPRKPRGRPRTLRGAALRTMLSFGVLKDDLGLSYTALEEVYRSDTGTSFNAPADESNTFKRYVKGNSNPRADEGRLAWSYGKSNAFAAMHASPLFELLEVAPHAEEARNRFTCWLWRTTVPMQIGIRYPEQSEEAKESLSRRRFHEQMSSFMQAPRTYEGVKETGAVLDPSLIELEGLRFTVSVAEGFDLLHKNSCGRCIPAPYQLERELSRLLSLDHPDALCIMLLGVMHPGPGPAIRELAVQGSAGWLARWAACHPRRCEGMRLLLQALASRNSAIEAVIWAWDAHTLTR